MSGPEPLEAQQAKAQLLAARPELLAPHGVPQGQPVPAHCAECCTDPACPSCWLEGATVELELVPLPRR